MHYSACASLLGKGCLSFPGCLLFVSDQIMIDVFQVPPGLEMHVFGLIMASSRVAS